MGLLDAISAQTPQGEQLRSGLLGMASGLLQGGNYGAFGPALGRGLAGFQAGQDQAMQSQMQQQQLQQLNMLRGLQMQKAHRELQNQEGFNQFIGQGQASPVGAGPEQMQTKIQAALSSPNAAIREWGFKMSTLQNQGNQGMSGLVPTDQGYAYRKPDGTTGFLTGDDGNPLMPVSLLAQDPNRQTDISRGKAYGAQTGKTQAERESGAPQELATIDQMLGTIENVRGHPGFESAVGWQGMLPTLPGTEARGFVTVLDQLKGQTFMQAYQSLKGGGQITEVEGQKAEQAIARLDRAQSEADFKSALDDLRQVLLDARQRILNGVGQQDAAPAASQAQASPSTTPPRVSDAAGYQSLSPGVVEDGYQYIGGDPSSPSSWTKVGR